MKKYSLEKYRKGIENIRLFGFIAIGMITAFSGQLIWGLSIMLIMGVLDQIFIKPKLKPKLRRNS